MKKQNILILSLLILGLLFSATFGFKFNLSQGFEFNGFWISLPIQFLDFGGNRSNLSLTSQSIGYIMYLVFAILCLKRLDLSAKTNLIMLIVFLGLTGLVLFADAYWFIQDIKNQYSGQHFRVGLTVFLLGLSIFYRLTENKQAGKIEN